MTHIGTPISATHDLCGKQIKYWLSKKKKKADTGILTTLTHYIAGCEQGQFRIYWQFG